MSAVRTPDTSAVLLSFTNQASSAPVAIWYTPLSSFWGSVLLLPSQAVSEVTASVTENWFVPSLVTVTEPVVYSTPWPEMV